MDNHRLDGFFDDVQPLVVLGPEVDPATLERRRLPASARYVGWLSRPPVRHRCGAVHVALRELVDLRLVITGLRHLGAVRKVAVSFEVEPDRLPSLVCRPEWPPLDAVQATRSGGCLLLTFNEPVSARNVLLEIARSCGSSKGLDVQWPAVGVLRATPHRWPAADAGATVADRPRLLDDSVDFPPDVILLDDETPDAVPPFGEHPVLARSPVVTGIGPDLTWGAIDDLGAAEARAALAARGPRSLGGVDTGVFNPIGFDRAPTGAPLELSPVADGSLVLRTSEGPDVRIADGKGHIDALGRRALRSAPAVRLDWRGTLGPQHYCRFVAASAATGTPLVATHIPEWAELLLAPQLLAALGQPVDTDDRLSREEHSVRLRRASLTQHGLAAWRRSLSSTTGQEAPPRSGVSIVLVTRRPEMLPFALRQLARQRDADFEIILATHGFEPDKEAIRAFRASTRVDLTTLAGGSSEPFGALLNRASAMASADYLLKVDDDDWYGRDFVADLLLAQHYSGADVVGCGAEFTFLEQLWLTARRSGPSEDFLPFVAGGTLLVDLGSLRQIGGFRPTRKYVDAGLLSGMRNAGGTVYRTHGLGYVLRRGNHGHTWDPGLGFFLRGNLAADQWRGFRTSNLLEVGAEDRPVHPPEDVLGRQPNRKVKPSGQLVERHDRRSSADQLPAPRRLRRDRGRAYRWPSIEIVIDAEAQSFDAVRYTLDGCLRDPADDVRCVLLADWPALDEPPGELTNDLHQLRRLHEEYSSDARVTFAANVPAAAPATFRLYLPAGWRPGRAIPAAMEEMQQREQGLRWFLLSDGEVARLESTAAFERAMRTRRPEQDLDDAVDQVAGSRWLEAVEAGFTHATLAPQDAEPRPDERPGDGRDASPPTSTGSSHHDGGRGRYALRRVRQAVRRTR